MTSNFDAKELLGSFPKSDGFRPPRSKVAELWVCLCFFYWVFCRLQVVSDNYHRFLSKKKALEVVPEEPEKLSARDAFGIVMIGHGEEFGEDSAFGASPSYQPCLCSAGLCSRAGDRFIRNITCQIWPRDVQACYTAGDPSLNLQRHFLRITQDVPRRD